MWGDPGVSKKLRLSNGAINWGVGGQPVSTNIQPTGILRHLRLLTTGALTVVLGGGTLVADKMGYGNQYTLVTVAPNNQSPIIQLSGYGLQLLQYMLAYEIEFEDLIEANFGGSLNAETAADQFNYPTATGTYRNTLMLPIAQRIRSLGGDVGMWPLQNPAVTLQVAVTPNSASNNSPYTVQSLTPTAAPFLATGAATATLTTPTFEPLRELWQVPAAQADYPPFNLVSSWIEEQFQGGAVAGATILNWLMTPLSGILLRIGAYVFDSNNTNNGVAASNMTASNAFVLSYDANTPKFSESAFHALNRQHQMLGFDAPQGFYFHDLMTKDQTLQDTLNSHVIGNIKLQMNFNAGLGATSQAKVVKQILSPLVVK